MINYLHWLLNQPITFLEAICLASAIYFALLAKIFKLREEIYVHIAWINHKKKLDTIDDDMI